MNAPTLDASAPACPCSESSACCSLRRPCALAQSDDFTTAMTPDGRATAAGVVRRARFLYLSEWGLPNRDAHSHRKCHESWTRRERSDGYSLHQFYVSVDVWTGRTTHARRSHPGTRPEHRARNDHRYAFTFERGSGVTMTSGATDISKVTARRPPADDTGTDAYHLIRPRIIASLHRTRHKPRRQVYELPNVETPVVSITATVTAATERFLWAGGVR